MLLEALVVPWLAQGSAVRDSCQVLLGSEAGAWVRPLGQLPPRRQTGEQELQGRREELAPWLLLLLLSEKHMDIKEMQSLGQGHSICAHKAQE